MEDMTMKTAKVLKAEWDAHATIYNAKAAREAGSPWCRWCDGVGPHFCPPRFIFDRDMMGQQILRRVEN